MALVNCSECGREVSDTAAACPGCGAPPGLFVAKTAYAAVGRSEHGGIARDTRVGSPVGKRVEGYGGAGSADSEKHARLLDALRAEPTAPPASYGGWTVIRWVLALGAVFWLLSQCGGPDKGASSRAVQHHVALERCQSMFKRISKDPEHADVPYVRGTEDAAAYYFAWGTETTRMRMRNGLGLEVPSSGTCYVNKSTGTVTQMTLNGETII